VNWYTVVMLGLAGFLIGGVISFARQRNWVGTAIMGVGAVLAGAGVVLWWGAPA
jgi:hypothetical protein